MKKKYIITVSIILFILIVGVFAGPVTSYVEKPDYDIIASNENIEIRRYGPMIVAEVGSYKLRPKLLPASNSESYKPMAKKGLWAISRRAESSLTIPHLKTLLNLTFQPSALMQKCYEPISLVLIPSGTSILLIPSFWVMRFPLIERTIHAKSTFRLQKKILLAKNFRIRY